MSVSVRKTVSSSNSNKSPKRTQVTVKQLARGNTYLVATPDGGKAELEFLGTGTRCYDTGPIEPMPAIWGDIPLGQASYSTRWVFTCSKTGEQVLFKKGYNKDSKGILVPESTPENTFSQAVKIYK